MNNVSEQLLKAMDIIIDEKLTQLQYDKTVQATIYSVADIATGEYKVRYNGNIFSAFSADLNKTYKVDDAVFITVPEGDFSNKKLITSLVSADSLSSAQLSSLSNSIIEKSPSFDKLYAGIYDVNTNYGVIAGAPVGDEGSQTYIYQGPDTYSAIDYHGLFQQYANNYEYIRIKGSFLTQFYATHNQGNYGLEVEFYTKDNASVGYRLDLQNFNGNPYGFSVYTPQEIILKVQKNYLIGLKSIKLFEEEFNYDKNIQSGVENKTKANIFVKDIILQFVDKEDLSNTTYYLTIIAPKGIVFTDKITSLDLTGRLLYKGENVIDNKKCTCQWYERDLNVMVGVDGYDKSAGFGWRKLEDKTSFILSLDASDVIHQQRYKLVVVYNDDIIVSAETEVWNRTTSYDYTIEQVTEGADIKLQLKNNFDDEVLVGNWFLSYPDGSYTSITEGKNKTEIIVSSYLQYSFVTFYCEVYNANGDFIGTLEHTITNSENESDLAISYIGEDTFRYDANGDVAIEDAEKERTLQVSLTWKKGYGTSYFVSWVVKDTNNEEHELPTSKESAYSPDNSMIENLWVDNYNILHYNIKQKYKVNFNNNTVIVKIKTISESVYSFSKEILCLKDGDQGTNGTTYVAAIRPCDSNGVKLSGLQPLRYNNGWTGDIWVRCYVYKDGELINEKADITYKWQGTNVTVENKESTENFDQALVRGASDISANPYSSAELAFYVKVQVTIKNDDSTVDVYAFYPLDVIIGATSTNAISIDSIPSYVKYNSSGLTPSFYSNDINFYYNDVAYNDNITSLNTSVLTIKTSDGKKYLEPAASFIFENIKDNSESNIGVLNLAIPDSTDRLIHPIIMYLDTYGNEAINGWDGTALDTGNGEYVFAPQVGAGTKESDNTFTGVVMGRDSGQIDEYGKARMGLYGYQKGVNTFGLMEDGTAFFGSKAEGGQIVINGTTATIVGGGGGDKESGMTITLANLNPDKSANAIKVGGGAFQVSYDGTLKATKATISGTIEATDGTIGGWTIGSKQLSSNKVVLNSDKDEAMAIWAGNSSSETAKNLYFAVSKEGELYAKSGNIGGWDLGNNYLRSTNGKIGLSSSGEYSFWSGASDLNNGVPQFNNATYFNVSQTGKMSCRNANISGEVTATSGSIGGWTIGTDSLSSSNNKITLNSGTGVISGGTISGATISGGIISGAGITCNSLDASAVTLNGSVTFVDNTIEQGQIKVGTNTANNQGLEICAERIRLISDGNLNLAGTLVLTGNVGTATPSSGVDGQIYFVYT